jgi:transcriptional regulator with XRE-family HTH domain
LWYFCAQRYITAYGECQPLSVLSEVPGNLNMGSDLALVVRDIADDMSSARARLARNVRLLLAKNAWNQLDLARRTGLSQGMISQLLAGEKGVRLSTLDKVANALGVDIGDLFASHPTGTPLGASELQSAMRSAVSRAAGSASEGAADGGRKILVDPEELREIGFAIGYAIVEATQHQNRRPDAARPKGDKSIIRRPQRSQAK